MADILALYNKINKPEIDLDLLFDNLFEEVFYKVKQSIKERWRKGENPVGNVIGWYTSEDYALEKMNLSGRIADMWVVDLTYSGLMGDRLTFGFIDVAKYNIFSTVDYYDDIVNKFGEWNFNVGEKEKEKTFIEIATKLSKILINKIYNNG